MKRSRSPAAAVVAEADLGADLELLLARVRGHPARIVKLVREPNGFATRAPVETVTIELEDGEALKLFVKRPIDGPEPNPDARTSDREIRVYERLLLDGSLPVVRSYGSIAPAGGRPIAILEHVDAWNLKYHGLDRWYEAARRLAHLHVHFAGRRSTLSRSAFLLRIDRFYVLEWLGRAIAAVAVRSAELAAALDRVTGDYERVARVIEEQPPTLVHNDLAPKNVLVVVDPARVCFVDWELAAVGCGPLDLVHLAYGLDREAAAEMCRVYCEDASHLLPASAREREAVFAACEAHKMVYRLAFSSRWKLPLETVAAWISEIDGCVRRV